MKILISGSDKHYAIENIYCKYLNELRVDTKIFAGQTILQNFIEQSFINRVRNRLGFVESVYALISKQLEEKIEEDKPDVVLVFKGMEILPDTIKRIKQKKIFIANYNPDHPFIFSGRGSGNANVTKAFPHYDLHFCYSKLLMQEIEKEYKIPTAFLPFGFELSQQDYDICQQETEIPKVCFLGNPDVERVAFLKKLVALKVPITIHGHHWNRYFKNNDYVTLKNACYQLDYWKTLRKYRLQLNILRKHNVDSHNMRTFEAPAIGGIQLADDTTEHRLFFEPEKDIFLFKGVADCAEKIKYILGLEAKQINLFRESARLRSLTEDYSYKNRVKNLIKKLQSQKVK
jgi:spore maturation protein CgeB